MANLYDPQGNKVSFKTALRVDGARVKQPTSLDQPIPEGAILISEGCQVMARAPFSRLRWFPSNSNNLLESIPFESGVVHEGMWLLQGNEPVGQWLDSEELRVERKRPSKHVRWMDIDPEQRDPEHIKYIDSFGG